MADYQHAQVFSGERNDYGEKIFLLEWHLQTIKCQELQCVACF